MNNFTLITPSKLIKKHPDSELSLHELRVLSNLPETPCIVCGVEDAWKYGQTGLCFTCTTGEADASDDYELIPEKV